MNDYIFDPRFARARALMDENPNRAWLAAQSLRDDYGWKNPELASFEHEAYMRRAFDEFPYSTALIGLPQALAYPAIKAAVQSPWGRSLVHMVSPGLAQSEAVRGLQEASPATMDQLGAGVSGWYRGLLDWLEKD